ncbi:MAG: hypothetical protein IK016_02300 [Lachnospiraceae bacterium]|nr:hypothetical protein [Lachnospiraceae bacterium]
MADVIEYKCQSCGGRLEFDPTLQKMKCPFCESVFEMSDLQSLDDTMQGTAQPLPGEEEGFQQGAEAMELSGNGWSSGEDANMRVYGCQSCGAEIIADATTGATACPYCGNNVVMKGQFSGDLRPDLLIPFKLTKEQAVDQFKKHINSQKYVPKVFSAQGHPEEIKGVYVPFWLYTADADADVTYNAQRVRSWSDRNYNYTETEHYHLRRAGTIRMEHVPVDGSSKMADDLSESIEPFDTAAAVPFTTAYLAGYLADRYDVDYKQCKDRAMQRMRVTAEESMRSTVSGYTAVTTASSYVTWNKAQVQYALFPVWMLSTQWEGQNYLFAMNGQSGKFVGNLPLDKKALGKGKWKFGLILGVALFVGLTLLQTFI